MKRLFLYLMAVASSNTVWAEPSWKLTVIFPDSEEKTFLLDATEFVIPMKKTSTKCVVTETKLFEKNDAADASTYRKSVLCESPKVLFFMPLLCDSRRPDMGALHVMEGKKYYRALLKCNQP